MENEINVQLNFRWLGVAGIELVYAGQVLLIDPYLTRIPFWRQWAGKLHSDRSLVNQLIPQADDILVTHCHYDHYLDTPGLAITTGAEVYGSVNTCQLSQLLGVSADQVHTVELGNSFDLGNFTVKVFLALHRRIPFFLPGSLKPGLRPPFNARQYHMDENFSYLISVNGYKLLVNAGSPPNHLEPAEILFLHPFHSETYYRQLLKRVQPQLVIPIHWDDLWRPLSQPPRTSFQLPRLTLPPLRRLDLGSFQSSLQRIDPALRFFIPERLKVYDLLGMLKG